ncbi:Polysaccharide pyruvyl transferase [Rosistilla ulvae]|uniref:Polysaccharide pyruvyl transferase n=1 Tax=Rosistilla ulvae TaxID=1930277 RepID=A0A517M0D7_9BACT|nr:polysaccharide pyruvyl transferase family protein [Rosistilla ulvae]QDS88348.1 Polysaccharide pyruvyl transferase [Rosistilla ulvae]
MAHAIGRWAGTTHNDVCCAVQPACDNFRGRGRAGLSALIQGDKFSKTWFFSKYAPEYFLQQYGIVADQSVDATLDASGFAYGDQWGRAKTEELLTNARKWKKQGRKIILLPQSVGTFNDQAIADNFKKACDNIDYIFPRDKISVESMKHLDVQVPFERSPDFTILAPALTCYQYREYHGATWLIPNVMILEKGSDLHRANYLEFFRIVIANLLARGERPVVLAHSQGDRELSRTIAGNKVPLVTEKDPLMIKGLISNGRLVVGSRYHAIVSALCSLVPAVGVGWSHKYSCLFSDFGITDLLLQPILSNQKIDEAITKALECPTTAKSLERGRDEYGQKTTAMWNCVEQVLF